MRRNINKTYKLLVSEKRRIDGYKKLLLGFAWSSFGDFESYLRCKVDLDKLDNQTYSKQCKSQFIASKTPAGIYSIKLFWEATYTMDGHEGTKRTEKDGFIKKTNSIQPVLVETSVF